MKPQSLLPLALAGFAVAQSRPSLTDALASNNDTLSELNGLLKSQPALARTLGRLRNVTILAPSNDAIEALLNDTSVTNMIDADPGAIGAILQYHVLNGTYYASNFTDTPVFAQSLLNNQTFENVTGGQVVEGVAMDDTVSFYSGFRAQSNVTEANLNFTGGVIHIINRVLTIPKNLTDTAIAANLSAAAGALTQAELAAPLVNSQNITVFAPSNGAFAEIGSVVGDLSDDDLESILKYHVINGTVGYSSTLKNGTLKTSEGEELTISIQDGDVYVNEAKVIIPDVLIANGVVHVIDGVLNPENPSATADPTAESQAPAFSGASSASDVGVPFTSGVPAGTQQATGLTTATSTEAAPHATAAIALGALLGGAAIAMNF
ncbi:TGF beta induced ig-h3 precursor [Fusarium albosuccineum]|uniref:TGF beta induced ig-h3 n=1 Tax=Fusarium albosuccineum TaxID=1237068 RepID=A0A8H4P7Z3_9HYPO|nr:TGF beta induced ig-h3 precursor [Fusarium albosuccineum]